jgi:hypothetical protein
MTNRTGRDRSREKDGDSQHLPRRGPPREFRRQAMALAGKGLAGTGGLGGIVAYVANSATQHSWPVWPYGLFGGMLVAGAALFYLTGHRPAAEERRKFGRRMAGAAWVRLDRARRGRPAVAGWRYITVGAASPGLIKAVRQALSHAGDLRPASRPRLPSVRVGIRVTAGPIGAWPSTADLRDSFRGFLHTSPVSRLLRSLTYTDGDLAWHSYDGNGRLRNEAVLAGREHQWKGPAAVAVMTLSEEGASGNGDGPRTAELVLHIEPRDDHGDPAPPADFAAWHESLVRALAVPGAFAQFLRHDVDVMTYDDPPVQVAVQFQAGHNLSELFDTGGIRPLPGSRPSNSFLDCMTAERVGQAPADAVTDILTRVCDHALHLENGYEDALAKLRPGR